MSFSAIQKLLDNGMDEDEIITSLMKSVPSLAKKASKLFAGGWSPKDILNIFSQDRSAQHKFSRNFKAATPREVAQYRQNQALINSPRTESQQAKEEIGGFLKTAAPIALGAAMPAALRSAAPMAEAALGRILPKSAPLLEEAAAKAGQPTPTTQAQNLIPNSTAQQPPVSQANAGNIAQSPVVNQAKQNTINSGEILTNSGLKGNIDKILESNQEPEKVAGAIRQMFKQKVKDIEKYIKVPFEKVIEDYIANGAQSQPDANMEQGQADASLMQQPEAQAQPVIPESEYNPVQEGIKGKEQTYNLPFDKLNVKGLHLRIADENLKNGKPSVTPNEPIEASLNLDTGKLTLEDGYHRYLASRGGDLSKAAKNNIGGSIRGNVKFIKNEKTQFGNEERPATEEEIKQSKDKIEEILGSHKEEAKPIAKADTVSTPHGIGEVREIRGDKALVEVDGKLKKIDVDELEKPDFTEDEIADAYEKLMSMIPESERSGFISWAGYDEDRRVLGYIPRGGKYEELTDITPEEAEIIRTGKGVARTSGERKEGLWIVGGDTRGLISQIQHDRRRKREAADAKQLKFEFNLPKPEKQDKGMKPIFDEMAHPRGLSRAREKKKKDEERARLKKEKDEAKKRKK